VINFPFISRIDVQWRYWLRLTLSIVIGIIAPQEIANAQMGAAHLDYGDDFGGGSSLVWQDYLAVLGSFALTIWLMVISKRPLWGQAVFYGGTPCLALGLANLSGYYELWEKSPTTRAFDSDDAMNGWLFLSAFVYFVYKSQCKDSSENKVK
jgi:hypothetical protein